MKQTPTSFLIEALADPDTYVWYAYQGKRLLMRLADGRSFHLEHLHKFGLRAIGKSFHLRVEADATVYSCRISLEQYQKLVQKGHLLRERLIDYPTVGRRIRLANKTFVPVLTRIVQTLGADSDRTQHLLVVLSNTLAALLHSYGVAISRVKHAKVSDAVIHDRFVGKMLAFLLEGNAVKEIPKTRINGYEMYSVLTPPRHGFPLSPSTRPMFILAKKELLRLVKTKMPKLLKVAISNPGPNPLLKCDAIAREAVLLCSVMAELLAGNHDQAIFNAKQLRMTRLD